MTIHRGSRYAWPDKPGWACRHCGTIYPDKCRAERCEAECALAKNIGKEMKHFKAGEHPQKQALAIAYGKTRRAGHKIPSRCGICNLFGHSTAQHTW